MIAGVNLAALGEESLRRYGEYVSLAFEGREWTNLERERAAGRLAHALRRRGIGPGDKLGSVGQPLPGVQVRIVDDDDRPLPVGEVGEVGVRGRNVMLGYYRLPEEKARALRNGWLHTGDVGRLDGDGFLYIVERKKDYPREVEEVLYAHPKVAEAAVIGTRDPVMGEDVLAFVALKPGPAAEAAELIAFCQERLARYKCPKEVRFLPALPKSPLGKVLRKELRARL
jgi:long-chain acyl-CoA synthetase